MSPTLLVLAATLLVFAQTPRTDPSAASSYHNQRFDRGPTRSWTRVLRGIGRALFRGSRSYSRQVSAAQQIDVPSLEEITENGPLVGAVGSIAAAGISWLGDVAIMREVRHQTAYLQKQIDELDLQVRWLTTAVKILQAAANKENEACAVIETLANQPKQSDIMADCGYAEDCYLLKYLLPFTQAYRKAAKGVVGCSGQSVQKVIIPELEEIEDIGYLEEDYHNFGDFTSEEEEFDDEHENEIGDGEEDEDEDEANSTGISSSDIERRKKRWRRKPGSRRRMLQHWPKGYKWVRRLLDQEESNLTST